MPTTYAIASTYNIPMSLITRQFVDDYSLVNYYTLIDNQSGSVDKWLVHLAVAFTSNMVARLVMMNDNSVIMEHYCISGYLTPFIHPTCVIRIPIGKYLILKYISGTTGLVDIFYAYCNALD